MLPNETMKEAMQTYSNITFQILTTNIHKSILICHMEMVLIDLSPENLWFNTLKNVIIK
jgi:hypothetical protein